jgi:hypothetical protein
MATTSRLAAQLRHVEAFARGMTFSGALRMPDVPSGLAIFVNDGSDQFAHRLSRLTSSLTRHGVATLLLGPCAGRVPTASETVFDVEFLARRAAAACLWTKHDPATAGLPLALCGHGVGAAAALFAAAQLDSSSTAVVSIDGRPDLAAPALTRVKGPVLLLVHAQQRMLVDLNRLALERMCGRGSLGTIPQRRGRSSNVGDKGELARSIGTWLLEQWVPACARSVSVPESRAERVRGPLNRSSCDGIECVDTSV